MYLVGIAWMYVAVMMAVAEATSSQGSLLGAFFTLLLYGVLPLSILLYIMGTGRRRKAMRQFDTQAKSSAQADGSHHATAETGAPVGKEP